MTARWYENVKRTYGDVDAYIATRHTAYLDRWGGSIAVYRERIAHT